MQSCGKALRQGSEKLKESKENPVVVVSIVDKGSEKLGDLYAGISGETRKVPPQEQVLMA